MVSATPLAPSHPLLKEQGFIRLKLIPTFNHKKGLTLIITNSFKSTLKTRLGELSDSPCVCVFMNKTESINAIIEEYGITDYKIFCSEKSVNKLRDRGLYNVFSEINYPLAKFNFFTCRFYSGVDIEIFPILPDIIMLTDLRVANYTMIDPMTEAIQIQGRFRKSSISDKTYRSLTHISTLNPNLHIKSHEELAVEISQFAQNYQMLKTQLQDTHDEARRDAIIKDLNSLRYSSLIDDSGEINPFAIDNLYNDERVKSYYVSSNALIGAYEQSDYFNINLIEHLYTVGEDDVLRISQTKSNISKRKDIVCALEHIRIDYKSKRINSDSAKAYIDALKRIDETAYILPIYRKIGYEECAKCEYIKDRLEKAVKEHDKAEADKQRFTPEVLNAISKEFQLGVYIPKSEIKERLLRIFRELGITAKVTQTTILDYYEASDRRSTKSPTYKLRRFKFGGTNFDAPP
ncbi:MAG: hypothetical protein NC403_02840 [Muribaculaceae bacterium]|nr:hypothetical protein [Muribaculaceae bacterium]